MSLDNLHCPKCNSEKIRIMTNLCISMPKDYFQDLTKRKILDKDVLLFDIDWAGTDAICQDCFYTWKVAQIQKEEKEKMKLDNLFGLIKDWAVERGLDKADPYKQMLKLMEEVGELAQGMAKNRPEQIEDSIGDIVVVLAVLSLQLGLSLTDCVRLAYEEIKNRKGRMINGVFVKESDLN